MAGLEVGSFMEIVNQIDLEDVRGGEIMLWAGIVGCKIIVPIKVDDYMKINAKNYCKIFFECHKSQPRSLRQCSFTFTKADYCLPYLKQLKRCQINRKVNKIKK